MIAVVQAYPQSRPANYTEAKSAIQVLDSLTSVYSIDKNRLYVYGISMGGEGVFDLLLKLPGKFVAAMSVCGAGQASWAENISKTPLRMFHCSTDDVNPPDVTERVNYRLVEIGASNMRYANYRGYQVFNHDTIFATVEFDKTQIIIDPSVAKGPFRVIAVNYSFKKSESSNNVEFKK